MQCTGPIRNPEVSQVSREPRPQNNTVTRGKGWGKQRKSRRRRHACAVILFLARSVSIQKVLYRLFENIEILTLVFCILKYQATHNRCSATSNTLK